MSLPGVSNTISAVDTLGQTSAPSPAPADSAGVSPMDAFSSMAGVTVRLLASLPANLGQHIDTAS